MNFQSIIAGFMVFLLITAPMPVAARNQEEVTILLISQKGQGNLMVQKLIHDLKEQKMNVAMVTPATDLTGT